MGGLIFLLKDSKTEFRVVPKIFYWPQPKLKNLLKLQPILGFRSPEVSGFITLEKIQPAYFHMRAQTAKAFDNLVHLGRSGGIQPQKNQQW